MKKIILVGSIISLPFISTGAIAQIFYEPLVSNSVSVPTLSGAMLLLMSALLVLVAKRISKKKGAGINMAIAALGVSAIVSGTVGVLNLSDVYADGGQGGTVVGLIDSPTGGSVPIDSIAFNIFENTSGYFQRIVQVNVPGGCSNDNRGLVNGVPRCEQNITVSNGTNGMCYVECRPVD